jgi:hypothetical protein
MCSVARIQNGKGLHGLRVLLRFSMVWISWSVNNSKPRMLFMLAITCSLRMLYSNVSMHASSAWFSCSNKRSFTFFNHTNIMSQPASPRRLKVHKPGSPPLTHRNAKQQINYALIKMEQGNYMPLAILVQTIAVAITDQYMTPFRADRNARKHPMPAMYEALLGLVNGIDLYTDSDNEATQDKAAAL